MARRDVRRIVMVGEPVDVDEAAVSARVRSSCGCDALWQPPNLSLLQCATCPDGAVNRFAVDFGYWSVEDDTQPEWPFAGTQQLIADPNVACRWATSLVTFHGTPDVDAQWVLDLSATPVPTLTLDVGVHGKIVYEMDAPSFGCLCPTPFRKKCVATPFTLTTPCEVCVKPPFQYCGNDIPIPDTLVATTSGHTVPNANGWNISLSYTPQADWGPTWGIKKGWVGTFTTNNGVLVYMVLDPCIGHRNPPSPPNGMLRFNDGPCVNNAGGPFDPPQAPATYWMPLYCRSGVDPYDLQPVEIGLRGMLSECDNDQVPNPGYVQSCGVTDSAVCGSAGFGGLTVNLFRKWVNVSVTQ